MDADRFLSLACLFALAVIFCVAFILTINGFVEMFRF
jgi:hypothetical protein